MFIVSSGAIFDHFMCVFFVFVFVVVFFLAFLSGAQKHSVHFQSQKRHPLASFLPFKGHGALNGF